MAFTMAEIIKVSRSDGPVSARLRTSGPVSWRHVYVSEDKPPFTTKGADAAPRTYDLGAPAELDIDQQSWLFRVANTTDRPQRYTVSVEWIQSDRVVHEWIKSGTLQPDQHRPEPGDGILLAVLTKKRR
jgi:hypothetical protein